jgi:NAD(P)-dependent dehydrogenase (short-subunit alcohol dehydrogenase family)
MPDRGEVVITGASTGIGRTCALHLDELGFDVLAGVRRQADGEALRASASDRLRTPIVDVTEPATITSLADEIADRPLAGLVNNAGIGVGGPLEFVSIDEVRRQFEVNVIGLIAVTQALMPALRVGHGRIVNIGSVGGRHAVPFLGPYAASKHAVEAITDSLRQELRPWSMHVAVIEPGSVATPIWEKGESTIDELETGIEPRGQELYGGAIAAMRRVNAQAAARAVPPERVAQAVAHALTAARPRTRYVIGRDARAQIALKTLLPDRTMDRVAERLMGL